MAKITTGTTNGDIKIVPNGTGKTVVGTGAASATVQSSGNHDLVLQTGNLTTGSITITDGANGDIAISPNGTGEVDISKVDIDGGTIDGVTIGGSSAGAVTTSSLVATTADIDGGTIDGVTIGGSSAEAGTFTTVNATTVDSTNLEVTYIKAKDGTAAGSIADSTGVVTLASSVLTTADINGGTIDGSTIGGTTPAAGSFTQVNAGDGAAATPSITNTGDTNTGIYFPAADTVGVSTGGTERLRIDSSGHVCANTFKNLAGTGAPDFPNGLVLSSNATGGSITGVTLDDYEEGTWNVSTGATTNISSLSFTDSRYLKVGSLVMLTFSVTGNVASSNVETRINFSLPINATSTAYSEVGIFSFYTGIGDNRFGIGAAIRPSTSSSLIAIYIAANQMNATGTLTGKFTLVYQAA